MLTLLRAIRWLMVVLLAVMAIPVQAEPAFRDFFDKHPLVMLLIEPKSGEIRDVNTSAVAFYGYHREQMLKMKIDEINTLSPQQIAEERLLALKEGRNHFIFRHRLQNGDSRTVEVFSRPYTFDGEDLLLSVVHDVSTRRQSEPALWNYQNRLEQMVNEKVKEIREQEQQFYNLLYFFLLLQAGLIIALLYNIYRRRLLNASLKQHAEALDHANQTLRRFAEVSAHHLMEPIRRLDSYAQFLNNALSKELKDEDSLLALRFIREGAHRLRHLVRDIQLYLAASEPHGEMRQQDVTEVAHEVVQRLGNQILQKNAKIEIDVLPNCVLDRPRLRDVLSILIENALKYTEPSRQPCITLSGKMTANRSQYRIADNGIGIEPEYRLRVFRAFERVTVQDDNSHTGVGLAIVQRIVESAGGRVWIEENMPHGTVVIVELKNTLG